MAALVTIFDGATAVDIRVFTSADSAVQAQAEQLRDDLNAFVETGDPFAVVASDDETGSHIRVAVVDTWAPGDPDWTAKSTADGIVSLQARSHEWLTRAVAFVSRRLGKHMWLPNAAFLIQPVLPEISVRLGRRQFHDVQDTGAFGTSGDFQHGDLEVNFPDWQRINMVGVVSPVTSSMKSQYWALTNARLSLSL